MAAVCVYRSDHRSVYIRQGESGATGSPGETGPAGLKGDVGPVGRRGRRGQRGQKGHRGDVGLPGKEGDQGEKGEPGMLGPPGLPGIKGEMVSISPSPRWGLDSNTSCWGGGGGPKGPPLRSPKLLDRFPNFKRHSIALYVKYPYKVKNLTRRSLMTSQVRSKSEFSTFRAW